MTMKDQTLESIVRLNPTANPEFLAEFSHDELARYLDRLNSLRPGCNIVENDIDGSAPQHLVRLSPVQS